MRYAIMTDSGWRPFDGLNNPIPNDMPIEDFGKMFPRAHEHDRDVKACVGSSHFPNLNKLLASRR